MQQEDNAEKYPKMPFFLRFQPLSPLSCTIQPPSTQKPPQIANFSLLVKNIRHAQKSCLKNYLFYSTFHNLPSKESKKRNRLRRGGRSDPPPLKVKIAKNHQKIGAFYRVVFYLVFYLVFPPL